MTQQHYRVTLEQACAKRAIGSAHYQAGDLTAKGLLHFYIKLLIEPDTQITIGSSQEKVCQELGIGKSAFYNALSRLKMEGAIDLEALSKLQEHGILPDWLKSRPANGIEKKIRNRLHSQLGGLTEVMTPVGRIDLLTESEIIEVKQIPDWKGALGQVLVYSAFYPEHQKRIHLFGSQTELEKLTDVEAACLSFNVLVTGEEV